MLQDLPQQRRSLHPRQEQAFPVETQGLEARGARARALARVVGAAGAVEVGRGLLRAAFGAGALLPRIQVIQGVIF